MSKSLRPLTALALLPVSLWLVAGMARAAEPAPDAQQLEFFEKKIRPVLVKHCYECHSAKSKELGGELLLDTREATRMGGASGHAVVPGNLKESLLINAIRYEDFEMPPKERLPESVVADFERWVKMGAPDPRDGEAPVKPAVDLAEARKFWSFQPIQKPAAPEVKSADWPRNDIDRFVLAKLEANGLRPVADADPATLVRRIYLDLTGLPPTPEQAADFLRDPSPAAVKQLVDRLLDSPQFGERWGRHWLDVVRYGESTGMERNFTYPYAWRYRDYVIQSFNNDKPFDRFLTEQVAGDLLPYDSIEQRNEQLIATGMLALGTKSLNENNRETFLMDLVDEQIDVTSQAFMGITAACARCHDHKFDPISKEEYYSLAGIFRSTDTFYGTGKQNGNRQQGRLLSVNGEQVRPVTSGGGAPAKGGGKKAAKQVATRLQTAQKRLKQLRKQKDSAEVREQIAALEAQVKRLQAQVRRQGNDAEEEEAPAENNASGLLVMAVQDAASPSDTEVRIRGEANERGDVVPRGFLRVLTAGEHPSIESGSGRLEYARWMASRDNPLTARVAANRIWLHLFGRAIVPSVNNFGATGEQPTHPELLDHLAMELMDGNWSFKQLIRQIMTSRVYQLGSSFGPDAEAAQQADPDNNLLWRMNQRRLEAEAIRDSMLLASGQLDLSPGRGSVIESIGDGSVGQNIRVDRFLGESRKRSVYLPIVRGAVPELLQVFDFPDPSIIYGQREVTTVPTQSLFMMNNGFVIEQSRQFAERILSEVQEDNAQRVKRAYRLALAREAKPAEVAAAVEFIQLAEQSMESKQQAWSSFCQTLFACSEFRYVD